MYHSHAGHCCPDDEPQTFLVNKDNKFRCSDNQNSCRLFVNCSDNFGTDQVALKLSEELPMADFYLMKPIFARFARRDHDLLEVAQIGLHELAAQYDLQLYNILQDKDAPSPEEASLESLRALINECFIFLRHCDCCLHFASRLYLSVPVVLIHGAAHSSEMETLMSMDVNNKMSQQGRLHAVLVDDPIQLSPILIFHHETLRFFDDNRAFRFPIRMLRQFYYMFQSLYRTNRYTVSWLTDHYRSHPSMARLRTRHI